MNRRNGQPTFVTLIARNEQVSLSDLLRTVVTTVADLHTEDTGMHRLLVERALRTPELLFRLREVEHRIAEALARELIRLGVAGASPPMTALLVVQGINAHIHGLVLHPPVGHSSDDSVAAVERFWNTALAPHPDTSAR